MTERGTSRSEVAAGDGLFGRKYAASTVSFAGVMFLTGLAAAGRGAHPAGGRPGPGRGAALPDGRGASRGREPARRGARRRLGGPVGRPPPAGGGGWSSRWSPCWSRPPAPHLYRQLAAGRFLDGVAGGMVAVSINTAIGQAYPDRLRPRALALMSTCWIVPSLAGPPLAGLGGRLVVLAGGVLRPGRADPAAGAGRGGDAARPLRAGRASSRRTARTPRPALAVAAAGVSAGAALAQYGISGWDLRISVAR